MYRRTRFPPLLPQIGLLWYNYFSPERWPSTGLITGKGHGSGPQVFSEGSE